MSKNPGSEMYQVCTELFPICRSITGNGVRKTLEIIKQHLPNLQIHEVRTGTKCFDWTVPKEWNISDAYIESLDGKKIIDFKKNNLHVMSYSTPVDEIIGLNELKKHLYTLKNNPEVIPYVTSYYEEKWGFCLSQHSLELMKDEKYRVRIDSTLSDGYLTYAELIIPGKSKKEIFLSTYMCHPSLANNELSGPVLATFLAKYILKMDRTFTYRIIFVPETIGAIVYLSKHLEYLKENVYSGFQLTCVGDNRTYSYLPTIKGNTITDKVIKHVLKHKTESHQVYLFSDRGSDERQYCSPGVNLPVASLMRSKYGEYPEYHTSLDSLEVISAEGLQGAFDVHVECIYLLEQNARYKATCIGEPQLGKRGLRSNTGGGSLSIYFRVISDILAYADGEIDLIDMGEMLNLYARDLVPIIDTLLQEKLLERF